MKTYAWSWFIVTAMVSALGVCLALISLPVSGLVVLAMIGAGGAVADVVVRHPEVHRGPARGIVPRLDRVLMGAALAVGAGGWIDVLGPYGLLVVALLAAGAPGLVSRCIAMARAGGGSGFGAGQSPSAAPLTSTSHAITRAQDRVSWTRGSEQTVLRSVRSRSDHEVVNLWRTSYAVLLGSHSAEELQRLVLIRRFCLDELERRHPEGFGRWLPEAHPASDPTSYLTAEPEVRPDQ